MSNAILSVQGLYTHFATREGVVKAVNGVSLELQRDSVMAVVGESGSGKTVTALSILGLVPYPGKTIAGHVWYEGRDLLTISDAEMRHIRGKEISLIFQDAGAALNPVIPIGKQVEEIMLEHTSMRNREARALAIELLGQMGIPDARRMLNQYPFQLSGGMAQRVMMAIGVALKPKVLIADEPTSNIDVTLQAEILQRLRILRAETRSSILLITHDLGVVAQMADTVAVMYGGMVMEYADTRELFARPRHPYTWGLFQALPRLDGPERSLRPMPGAPRSLLNPPDQCPFLERCPKAINTCRTSPAPRPNEVEADHLLACYNPMDREIVRQTAD